MSTDVTLSAALRSNLLSLQNTQSNIDKVQNALSTGLKVSSALDNPQNYFAARSLNNRAGDLTKLLDGIGQSISTIKQADKTVTSLTKLVEQADSIIDSAQTAAADAGVASVTGNVSLKGITDLENLPGIVAGSTLSIKVSNPDDAAVTYTVTAVISDNDSIDELLAKINYQSGTVPTGSYNSASEQVIEASLDADGQLKIKALNGGNLQIKFIADGTDSSTTSEDIPDLAFASDLGFGQLARSVEEIGTAGNNAVQITAIAGNKLTSGVFYAGASGDTYANASALLSSVYDSEGTRTKRFGDTSGTDSIDITINDTTTIAITYDDATLTIQGFVDKINTNATLKNLVKASYDATSGQLSIEKTSSNLKTIEIGSNTAGTLATSFEADFDFGFLGRGSGTTALLTTNTSDASEVFTFSGASGELGQLATDYNKVREQIDALIGDSAYRGANLLAGEDLTTYFNEDRSNSLVTSGQDLTTVGLGIGEADFSSAGGIGAARTAIRDALETVRSYSSSLANDLSIIQAREEFTKETVNNLKEGADKLTLADQNEEGAKLLALQTRQQLGVTALSLAAQSQQSVLRLF